MGERESEEKRKGGIEYREKTDKRIFISYIELLGEIEKRDERGKRKDIKRIQRKEER